MTTRQSWTKTFVLSSGEKGTLNLMVTQLCAIWGSIISHLVIIGGGGGALSGDLIGGFPDAEIRLADSRAGFLLVEPAPR